MVFESPAALVFGTMRGAGHTAPVTWTKGSRLFGGTLLDRQTQVTQDATHLTFRPPANAQEPHFSGYHVEALDLTGAMASVGVQPSIGGSLTSFALIIGTNPDEAWYAFTAENDTLVFISKENGVLARTSIPLDGAVHRFWRFRHDPVSNVLFWETRSMGGAWQVRHALTPQVPLTSTELDLSAGTLAGLGDPGVATFDTFGLRLAKH